MRRRIVRSFEFMYYCLYRAFALVERVEEKDERLASAFYSILLGTKCLLVFFILRYTSLRYLFLQAPYSYLLQFTMLCTFIICFFWCKNYFIKKSNHVLIVKYYEDKFK